MINEEQANKYCCEDISKIYGYNEAVADKENMWHCHHCLGLAYSEKQLKEMNLYYKRPSSELMFVTVSEHHILHLITNKKSIIGIIGYNKGKQHSDETKHRISEARKGYKVKESTKRKLSGKNTNNPKISKKVRKFTKEGDFICEYPSIQEALRQLGIKSNHISCCCNGKRKTAHGYVWRFAD